MIYTRRDHVTVVHEPSGMVAKADYGRSIVKRRDTCLSILRGKLWSLEHGAEPEPVTDAQRAIAERLLAKRAEAVASGGS